MSSSASTSSSEITTELAPRIKAVVVFGNPLSAAGAPLEAASDLYGGKSKSACGRSDNVCGGARSGNVNGGHLSYNSNGAVAAAARFAADRIDR